LPSGSYPSVSSHTGSWALNPSTHSLDWSIPYISLSSESARSGTLEFKVGGDDPEVFFPIKASFIAAGTLSGIKIEDVLRVDGSSVTFSQDRLMSVSDIIIN